MAVSRTWNLYISPLRMLLSTVPPKMYIASEITAAAWKSLPLGSWVWAGPSQQGGAGQGWVSSRGLAEAESGHLVAKDMAPLALGEGLEQGPGHSCGHRADEAGLV